MSWFKIFSAVLVANIVSWIIVTILGWFIFFVALDSFGDALGKMRSSKPEIEFPTISVPSTPSSTPEEIQARKEREKRLAEERQRAKHETTRRQNAISQSKKSCDFWAAQYKKDHNPESRGYRDMACSRYRDLLN